MAQAETELVARYGGRDDGERGLSALTFDPPAGVFLTTRTEGRTEPVGGAGFRTVATGMGEVRRLWVDPAWRGRGIGRGLMARLEGAAHDMGLSLLRLEAGNRQLEAVSLYQAMRWERVFLTPKGRLFPRAGSVSAKLSAEPPPRYLSPPQAK